MEHEGGSSGDGISEAKGCSCYVEIVLLGFVVDQ